MTKFHNPYHFIPCETELKGDWLNVDAFKKGQCGHITHARYAEGDAFFHGRLVCRLTTKTPLFIGGSVRQKGGEEESGHVEPFKLEGERAIPASSLRGLISSIAEAASNSSMRILKNQPLSCRKRMDQALAAVGRLKKDAQGRLKLQPLTLPLFAFGHKRNTPGRKWKQIFPTPALPVLLARKQSDSFSNSNAEYWYMKVTHVYWKGESLEMSKEEEYSDPITEEEYQKCSESNKEKYTRGALRVLGITGREKEIPFGKKKELFLPMPKGCENPLLEIDKPLEVFHRQARHRVEKDKGYPFLPEGRHAEEAESFSLKENDLVSFTIDEDGNVTELAIASIWRSDLGMLFDYFEEKELLPFNPDRKKISPAEQLFGFVENRGEEKLDTPAVSFASRVRFSNGRLGDGVVPEILDEVLLKILDSPKPPSPALYFTGKNDENAIDKGRLSPTKHKLQGRKIYLHHGDEPEERGHQKIPFWETQEKEKRIQQKVKIRPLQKASFWFHIDFDNLSHYELGMLLYALRPTPEFHHKIGMGKPLGLGTVLIEPVVFQRIDRKKRYSEDDIFTSDRYAETYFFSSFEKKDLPEVYAKEDFKEESGKEDLDEIQDKFKRSVASNIHNALQLFGNPNKVQYPILYPMRNYQINDNEYELNGYEWFVKNDNLKAPDKQQLRPVGLGDDLPYLQGN